MKTITISKLIEKLQMIKKEFGDLKVYLSSDTEGNSYGTIECDRSFGADDDFLVIYPFQEYIDYEEIVSLL